MDPIDNVPRDSKDGTYRCPQCQTPFTRRSNLRRHFQIHLRGITSLKCEVCNEEHSTKDSLQDHVANSHSPTWNVSHEKPLRRFVIPQDITSHSPLATVPPPSYGPYHSSQSTSINQYPNLVPSVPSCAFQVPNFGRSNFATSGSSSELSSTAILPRSTPSSTTSDRCTPMVGFPPSSNPFSHRHPSTSLSSTSSESSIASSSPYTRMGQPVPQQGPYGVYPSSEAPPSSTHQEWIAGIMGQHQGFDASGDEWPIYTRRDVKNMLDAVSDCFIESVEHILIVNGQRPPNPARLNNQSTTLDTRVRQMILDEAIPRLVSRVQGNDDVNLMSHAGSGC